MDLVTHGLAGALVTRAVAERGPWPMVAAAVGGALVPDLDVVARLWDPMAAITVHRTATHSVIGGLPLAAGVAGGLRLSSSRTAFWSLAALAYLGLLSHIGLDLLTPFGTAALWPLDGRRFALGWLYVIDPVVIGIAFTGLLLAAEWKQYAPQIAWGGLGLLVTYALAAGMMFRWAEGDFALLLRAERVAATRTVVVPVFPGPVRWLGVAETEEAIYRSRFSIGRRSAEPLGVFPKAASDRSAGSDDLPEVQAFRVFARLPWRTLVREGDAQVVEYRDLAFEDHPFGGPMALRIRLDRSGAVGAIELGHRL